VGSGLQVIDIVDGGIGGEIDGAEERGAVINRKLPFVNLADNC